MRASGPVFDLAKVATTFLGWRDGGLPLPRLTVASASGELGDNAAATAVDSMTAEATAEAALTGLLLLV